MTKLDYIYLPATDGTANPAPNEQLLGGKGYNLARLVEAEVTTSPWFAVTTLALQGTVPKDLSADSTEAIKQAISEATLPERLIEEIRSALTALRFEGSHVAVRSSAVGEDSTGLSYAGQLESYLFVQPEEIAEHVRKVWLSAYSSRVVDYRKRNGLPPAIPGVAVIVQKMVNSDVSGVSFGIDPLTGAEDSIVISSLYGLGEGLVSGAFDADSFTVRDDEITSTIAPKPQAMRLDTERGRGITVVDVPEKQQKAPSLSFDEIQQIATATKKLNQHFGKPQDVEWGIADGKLYILQSRPVTAVAQAQSGGRIIWDNSNIIESYSGITTPLTFSFIKGVYTEVYKELTRILGVTGTTIAANERVFQMLGLIRGRVYYNLLNWYRVLALLPGYRINAGLMEGMMGVKERLEEKPDIVPPDGSQVLRLVISVYQLIANLIRLPKEVQKFHRHLNKTLAPFENKSLRGEHPEKLIAHYQHLQTQLLQRWRTPILNDFYTMIFHGLLKKRIESWESKDGSTAHADTLHNDLLIGEGEIISTEPIRRLRELAKRIRSDEKLTAFVETAPAPELLRTLQVHPDLGPTLNDYLQRFGDRYAGELKLETITPKQEPVRLAEMIRNYVRSNMQSGGEDAGHQLRKQAEKEADRLLKGKPIQRFIFRKILRTARERVKARENLRFERTRVFAVVREIFLALGEHFAQRNLIDNPRDILYLGVDEVFALATGTALSAQPKGIVSARKAEFTGYHNMPAPPDRFETHGVVAENQTFPETTQAANGSESTLHGVACCPGVVTAPVRIVTDPSAPVELRGHILVAERTDPGWAPLFPLASGLLVERGSLLSHSAIVAREMGIPAVVAVPDLLQTLQDGEVVTMDGAQGTIVRHAEETSSSAQVTITPATVPTTEDGP